MMKKLSAIVVLSLVVSLVGLTEREMLITRAIIVTSTAHASTTIPVTTNLDAVANDGYCSLREAIKAANEDKASGSRDGECPAGSGINEVVTVPAGNYVLTLGPLEILDSQFLEGEGPKSTIIDGNNNSRVFSISRASEPPKNPIVSISGVGIQNGNIHEGGAGIYIAKGAHLNLINSTVRNNQAISLGGGIWNEGSLLIIDSTIQNNKISLSGGGGQQFTGGGILNTGILQIDRSTINGNEATRGGGISNGTPTSSRRGGCVEITNSTISGNRASTQGGGIANYGGTVSIRHSTITENEANTKLKMGEELRGGGGIYNSDASAPNLGRGGRGEPGLVFVENTIIAGNDDSQGGRRTFGWSLFRSGDSPFTSRDSDHQFSLDGGATWHDAYIVEADPNYHIIPDTRYIYCGPVISDPCGLNKTVRYRRVFALPTAFFTPYLEIDVHADNQATIFLNGVQIGEQPEGDMENFQDPPERFATTDHFKSGDNTLEFHVYDFGGASGLDYDATVNYSPMDHSPDCFSSDPNSFTSLGSRNNLVGVIGECNMKDSIWGDTRFDLVGPVPCPEPRQSTLRILCHFSPQIGPLADNGGPTLTHALLSDSPLIDLGSADCPETDQRGLTRPADGNRDGTANCDSGAFEFRANLLLNSSFELDSDGNDKPDNWSEGRRFTPTREIQPVEGEFVGRFRATDNTDETILQKMKVSGGTEYLFSCWANIPTTGDSFTFRFQVRWLDAGDASISTNTIKTYRDDTKGKWDQATGNQFAPSGAVTAQIRMVASSLNGTIYVDNCEFRPA